MVANIDDNVGRLEAFLTKTGLRENTILIFMSDNGGVVGIKLYNAGMSGGKTSLLDGGHRVPCFMRWPAAAGATDATSTSRLKAGHPPHAD